MIYNGRLVIFEHLKGYSRPFPYMIVAIIALVIGITIWHVAMWANLGRFIDSAYRLDAKPAKDQLSRPYVWAAAAHAGVMAFLWSI